MLDISQRIEKTIGEFLRELPETRGKVTLNYDDDGGAHLKGATDTAGYFACGKDNCRKKYPCRKHGAHGNPKRTKGRRIDTVHSAYGYTDQDVSDLRTHLKAIGITISPQEVEAALIEAQSKGLRATMSRMDLEEKRAKNREKIAKRRQWAKDNGYCIICTKNAASFRSDGSQCSTCIDCQTKANEAKKRKRSA